MMNPFGWIRQQAASAVVGGIADGIAAVTPPGETPPADLDQLRGLIAARLALPAAPQPDDNAEPAKRRGKVGAS